MHDYVIGVDIGGTIIKGALFNREGELLETVSCATQGSQGTETVLGNLLSLVNALRKQATTISAIGIGVAGILDVKKEVLLQSPNLKNLENTNLRTFLTEAAQIPVYLENDANAAALGEKWAGAGKQLENFLCITLGTGIGGGLILHHELWSGEMGKAGEFCHMIIEHGGIRCACGKNGCLEAYSSGEAMSRMAREALQNGACSRLKHLSGGDFTNVDAEMICHAARNGDPLAREIYQRAAAYLANVNNLLDIHHVILGGGVSKAFDVFAPFLREEIRRQVFITSRESIEVVPSVLGSAAGMYGAGYLALKSTAAATETA